jgi:hypothetical protein
VGGAIRAEQRRDDEPNDQEFVISYRHVLASWWVSIFIESDDPSSLRPEADDPAVCQRKIEAPAGSDKAVKRCRADQ